MTKENSKRVQANVNVDVAKDAEEVMDELGINPTTVINALYKKIAATGEIPFSFSLTADQKADLAVKRASRKVPVVKLRTKQEIEDFFENEN
ncbi:damage-inducible protein (plasmid) [Limosilactobacillus reuteri]|uniref:Damage-inducible protein n=1 Tax=Limosilactobacillus reuteri TaxID=1598 RepID=A0A517D8R5_LIMRT|nr:damage-inducible protein [Limosilactobacillus reuteri]